jgi:hypothetical protein
MVDRNPNRFGRKASRWLKEQIIQDVPEDIALCEFDCRKSQCLMGEWENCERRLERLQDYRRWKARTADSTQSDL